ncbi:GNAT family N-acetyltransferase [Streptomyces tendae]|uniref:GNAT family N-acetyltransferase n=1 Tax=Streptomyces tendae TaxID=1932 RepID=UPI0033DFD7E9
MLPPTARVYVAETPGDGVVASAILEPNQPGLGSHVAHGQFIVDPGAWNGGIGRRVADHVVDQARALGYRSMQFNAVVATDERAVALWHDIGMRTLTRSLEPSVTQSTGTWTRTSCSWICEVAAGVSHRRTFRNRAWIRRRPASDQAPSHPQVSKCARAPDRILLAECVGLQQGRRWSRRNPWSSLQDAGGWLREDGRRRTPVDSRWTDAFGPASTRPHEGDCCACPDQERRHQATLRGATRHERSRSRNA